MQRARSVLRISGFDLESSDVVSYAASFLTGAANSWFLSEADRAPYGSIDNGGFNNFDEFATALTRHMGDPNPEDKARKSLRSLRQTTSVKSYADEFQRLITYLPNRDPADLCFDFVTGLKPKIQELLVGKVTCDMKWQDVRDLAYRFDDVVMMNHRSFPSPSHRSTVRDDPMDLSIVSIPRTASSSRTTSPAPYRSGPSRSASPHPRGSSSAYTSDPIPKLTPEMRDKLMANNGCFRCRKYNAGHLARDCPGPSSRPGPTLSKN